MIVDWAMHPPNRYEELRAGVDALYGMGKGISNLVGMLRRPLTNETLGKPALGRPFGSTRVTTPPRYP